MKFLYRAIIPEDYTVVAPAPSNVTVFHRLQRLLSCLQCALPRLLSERGVHVSEAGPAVPGAREEDAGREGSEEGNCPLQSLKKRKKRKLGHGTLCC